MTRFMADLASFEPLSNFMEGEGGRILIEIKQGNARYYFERTDAHSYQGTIIFPLVTENHCAKVSLSTHLVFGNSMG